MPVLNQPALRSLPFPPLSLADRGPRHGLRRGPTYLVKEKGGSSPLSSFLPPFFSFFFLFFLSSYGGSSEGEFLAGGTEVEWNGKMGEEGRGER